MIFHENRLLADDSLEISYLIIFEKLGKTSQNVSSAAVVTGASRLELYLPFAAGDLCDTDIDGDRILNSNDTCVYLANPAQTDTDLQQTTISNIVTVFQK